VPETNRRGRLGLSVDQYLLSDFSFHEEFTESFFADANHTARNTNPMALQLAGGDQAVHAARRHV
jgi:hypothetical protein